MCSSILVAKKELRKRMVALLGRLAKSHVTEASAQACRHVVESRQFQEASSISLFLSMPGEFDTSPLLRAAFDARKSVFVPRVCGPRREDMQMVRLFDINDIDGAGFEQSKWGIPEPTEAYAARTTAEDARSVDLVLVPGLAFDARLRRLGRGKGYYDTYIAALADARAAHSLPSPTLMALALEEQLLTDNEEVPTAEHDCAVHCLALPSGIVSAPDAP